MTKILGLDPGKSTGWGKLEVQDRKVTPGDFGVILEEDILDVETQIEWADVVVIESFLVRPGKAREGSFDWDDMVAPRVIGALQLICRQRGKQVVMQSPSVKPPAYGFLGKKYKKGQQNVHHWDALAHAMYYAVTKLSANPAGKTSP